MIDVCVREHDDVDLLDVAGEPQVFLAALPTVSLKHPAVEKDGLPVDAQDVTGAGDFTGSTRKLYFHSGNVARSLNRPNWCLYLSELPRAKPGIRPSFSIGGHAACCTDAVFPSSDGSPGSGNRILTSPARGGCHL